MLVDQDVERDLSVDHRCHRALQRLVGRRSSLEEIQKSLGGVDIEGVGGQCSACRTYLADELTHHTCVIVPTVASKHACKLACTYGAAKTWSPIGEATRHSMHLPWAAHRGERGWRTPQGHAATRSTPVEP